MSHRDADVEHEEVAAFGIAQIQDMHYLYILIGKQSGKYYIGETSNIEKRIQRHRTGKTSFGKRNKDLEIVYKKEFNNRSEARKFENFLKEQKSHKFIDKLIKEQLSLPPSSVGRADGCQSRKGLTPGSGTKDFTFGNPTAV